MNLLALELSTRRASIALCCENKLLAEESWDDRHQRLFDVLPALLKGAHMNVNEVDVFAVGRGPGAFSGLRVAFTAAQTFALPAEKTVFAVSSGEALARAVFRDHAAPRVAVVGDARRGTLWYGMFDRDGSSGAAWSLTTVEKISEVVPADAVIVSPDWERLAPYIKERARWLSGNRFPSARDVAAIVHQRLNTSVASEPPEPLYMHPPV